MDSLPNELREKILLYVGDEELETCISIPYFSPDDQFWKKRFQLHFLPLPEEKPESWINFYKLSIKAQRFVSSFFKLYRKGKLDKEYLGWIDLSGPKVIESEVEKFASVCRISSKEEKFYLSFFTSSDVLKPLSLTKEEVKVLLYKAYLHNTYVPPHEFYT